MTAPLSRDARVLVRLPDWLGDFVMAEPAVAALERWCGERGRIGLWGSGRFLTLLDGRFPGAARLPDGPEPDRRWDVAVLLTGSFRSAWRAWRARVPRRAGWSRDLRRVLLTDAWTPAREVGGTPLGLGRPGREPRRLPRPFGATCVELVGALGVPVGRRRPELVPAPAATARVAEELAERGLADRPFLLANVGARPASAKAWLPESWSQALIEVVGETGLRLLLVSGPGEAAALREVAAGLSAARVTHHVWADPPPDLAELLALAGRAAVVATADSGPRHLAVAAGARVAVVMGPTDPRHTADHTDRTRIVRTVVPCGPCHREECPLEGPDHHRCMRDVPPSDLAAAVRGVVQNPG